MSHNSEWSNLKHYFCLFLSIIFKRCIDMFMYSKNPFKVSNNIIKHFDLTSHSFFQIYKVIYYTSEPACPVTKC